jgi:hypothetical protein
MSRGLIRTLKSLGRPLKRLVLGPSAPPTPVLTPPMRGFVPGPETLIFVHVPKAAGTTFETVIRNLYGGAAIYRLNGYRADSDDIVKFRAMPESERRRLKVLVGHVPFGLHADLPQKCTYTTLLRDPVERIISYYYYILRRTEHFQHQMVVDAKMSLADYVEFKQDWVHNGQALPPDELLRRAIDNLERHFPVIGLTERFDESLARIGRRLAWPRVGYQATNVTKDRPKQTHVAPALLERIRELNRLDLQLYDWAARRFDAERQRSAA